MGSKAYAVGLVGYGLAGAAFHAPLIERTPGLRVAAVVTRDPERGTAAQAAHPGARIFPTAAAMLERADDLDVVVVATPNRSHVPLAEAALDDGLVVVVDKPIAVSPADARGLLAHAAAGRGRLTVFQNRRWDGDFLTLRGLVDDGTLGKVWRLESRFERWVATPKAGWREHDDPADGGGALLDLGAHLVDQALLLLGAARRVYAELDVRRPGAVVVDDAFVAITHEGGARSHLAMGSASASPGPRFRVLGDRAGYTKYGLDVQEATLRSGGGPGDPGFGEEPPEAWGSVAVGGAATPVPTLDGRYQLFYAELVAALAEEGPMPVDPWDSVRALEVIEAAQRSAETGEVVSLPMSAP
jgi:predicted dehydrogenase